MSQFSNVPPQALKQPEPFSLHVSDEDLEEFKSLLKLSKIGPLTWENSREGFGVTREWLSDTKDFWLQHFDWRHQEKLINSFPNFKATVTDPVHDSLSIHFVALFSNKPDAIPIVFLHGWPGSFLEFFPMLELLTKQYDPQSLPYHIIVPSLPGYTLSSGPPLNRDFSNADAARVMNQLMIDLGFGGNGYIAQGGDIGSDLARRMAKFHPECKAVHLNHLMLDPSAVPSSMEGVTDAEMVSLEKMQRFWQTGYAYGMEHGSRPATIGLVLSTSPLALLAWVGEKFLEWADDHEPIPLETILRMVTLYWFTSTFPRSIYPYRWFVREPDRSYSGFDEKPFGYSAFEKEVSNPPKAWTEKLLPKLIRYDHEKGGHFPALEQPGLFLKDLEDFATRAGPLFKT
ncbi:epoxide hydrolase [Fusarium avenaceum]|nr:epoxide hydrolase [Fusarium avenaceum]